MLYLHILFKVKWLKFINDLNPPVTAVHNGSRGDVYPVELFV